AEVGERNKGNKLIRFETRITTANVMTTGKYFKPCGPTMSWSMSRMASTPSSRACCGLLGSSTDSLRLNNRMMITLRMQAMTNITVYQGIAVSGVYGPKAASGVVPKNPRNLVQSGCVYFISK